MLDRAVLIEELFSAAAEMPAGERTRFLDARCAGDDHLRREVEVLLATDDEMPEGYLDSPLRCSGGLGATTPGETIADRYRLIREIGEGGMGVVYLAEQIRSVRRLVAVKVLKAGLDTRQVISRFDAERQTLAMMDHPNVARVLDAGATDAGRPYFVMELIEGATLMEYCRRHTLGVRQRLELFLDVCDAVQHAHTKGVIHRDLKPSNVIVAARDGRPSPRVIDFGIAKAIESARGPQTTMTLRGQFVGTPEYMSPEQAIGDPDIDTRTDVYSLGAMLYELLTGQRPFDVSQARQAGIAEIERMIREVEPQKPSTRLRIAESNESERGRGDRSEEVSLRVRSKLLRGDLDWIVMRALEKDRARRYETAAALAADIRRHLANEPVEAGPPSTVYRAAKFVRRNRAFVFSALSIGVVLFGATGATSWLALRESAASRRAEEHATRALAAGDRAESVKIFLEQMLTRARSMNAESANVTVLDMLGMTTERLDAGALTGQPDVECEVRWIIGRSYLEQAWMPQAVPHFAWVLGYRERELGSGHVDTLEAMWAYGEALKEAGGSVEALTVFERFHELAAGSLGPDDHRTWFALDEIGNTLMRLGRADEALPLHRRTYEELTRIFGEGHYRTIGPLFNSGGCLRALGRHDEAAPVYRSVIAMFDASDSLQAYVAGVRARVELANILAFGLGEIEEGDQELRDAMERAVARLGANHGETAGVRLHRARFEWRLGSLEVAEQELRGHIAFLDRVYGRDSASVLSRQIELGSLLIARGDAGGALDLYQDSVRRIEASEDPLLIAEVWTTTNRREVWTAVGRCCESLALLELGRPSRAEVAARQALQTIEERFPSRGGHRSEALRLIGSALIGQDRLLEARQYLNQALDDADRNESGRGRARAMLSLARLDAIESGPEMASHRLASIDGDRWAEIRSLGRMWFPRVERPRGEPDLAR